MNIYFNYYLKNSLYNLPTPGPLTGQQILVTKIALGILSAFFAVYVCLKLEDWRQHVTVKDESGNTKFTHIKNVNGECTVTFNGYFASNAIAQGFFVNGQLNGNGNIRFAPGVGARSEESGAFKNGWLHQGQIFYKDGKLEEGEFEKGQLNGRGARTYPDGTQEKGIFKNGKYEAP